MREQFANEVVMKLAGKVSDAELRMIHDAILSTLSNYEVKERETAVTLFGKGSKYRTSFLNARAELMIRKYLHERDDNCPALIVTNRKPIKPLKKGAYEKLIRELGEHAGLERKLTPHIFRHTFATNLVKRGARIEDVQRLLGHEKISTTMIYTKVDTTDIRRDHERFIV